MTFKEILAQVIDWLQEDKRISYRALKRQFDLDDDYLDDLKEELLYAYPVIEDDRGLIWIDHAEAPSSPSERSQREPSASVPEPLSYTPQHLAEKILTSRSVLEGERKQVTVMFADIKDSTELIRDLDPEAAQKLLDPAIHIMMAAVHRFEGTVNQVLGDGIMALFGAPIAHEDHAIRACYAALAMQTAMRGYTDEVRRAHGIEMHMRVGLNSGEVIVRTIGNDLHMDYSAVGPTTHLAARMEQLAPPGCIRLTADTLRLAEGFVQVSPVGPVPVKGFDTPVEVAELIGASAIHRRLQASVARGLSRFVGRQHEVEVLNQALTQASNGQGQVVAVVGEAGVGKSRLLFEFIHSHRTRAWLTLESAAASYGQSTSYLLVTDLLKGYFQIEDRDTTQHIREKVTGKLLTLDEALRDTVPPILSLLEALPKDAPWRSIEPPYRRSLVLDALKRLVMHESQRQPVILVCEDLHWIDAESQTVLDMLVGGLPASRVLLLTNYRPEYDDAWGSKTYYTRLRLDPLPPQDADALLGTLLGHDPSLTPLKALLKERTEGNPFFLEESVRTLVETETLLGQPGAYRLAHDLDTLHMPATVQALLAARIDRLPAEAKQLLQSAAVIGTDAPLALIQDIVELPEADLQRSLAHLQEAEFLYETRLFPEPEYTFKHALTREVAYESLLHDHRRQLHQSVGRAIESRYPDRLTEFTELLAGQFERGEDWGKAVHYYRQAAEKVKAQHAYQNAVALCTHALGLVARVQGHEEEPVRILVLLGDLWSLIGDMDRANQNYEHAQQLVTDATVQRRIANKRHHSHTVVRDGARIAYYEHGSGDHTLVLAHPVAYGLGTFQPLLERLCQDFQIITIDPRGSGASDPQPGAYPLREHMEDVRAVIEASSAVKPVVAAGFSRGGTLMMILAATYPELVHQLVLISTHASPSLIYAHADWIGEVRAFLRQGDMRQAARLWASRRHSEPGSEYLIEHAVDLLSAFSPDIFLNLVEPNPEDDVAALLPQIQVPTLVVHGTADRIVPPTAGQDLAQQIAGAQFYACEGIGHGVIHMATGELCEVLRGFAQTGRVPEAGGAEV